MRNSDSRLVDVHVGGLTFHYEARGRGPPFVMLHGSPSDHRATLADLEPAFRGRSGWQRFYPDLPGHGQTQGSSRIRDMNDYLEVVAEFVSKVGHYRPVALGGTSFGAYLALGVARRHPKSVRGLLLSVPEIHHSPKEDRLDDAWSPHKGRTTDAHLPRGAYVEDTAWLTSLPWKDVRVPLYRHHPPLTCPTLLLFGRTDAPFRAETYWKVLPAFPRATYAILDGAGHALWRQKSNLAHALVRDWLDRMDA